jgi:hypothetical protein
MRSRFLFRLFSPPKDALTMFADAPKQTRQHRSARIVSDQTSKESMTGFAPATIAVVLWSNKASEGNVLDYYTTRTVNYE